MTEQKMKAVHLKATGDPDLLLTTQTAIPSPGADEILVKTAAIGVNFIETYQRSGVYPVPLPFTPGSEAAGTIVAVGEKVTGFTPGERVTTCAARASYAEYFIAPAEKTAIIPQGISDAEAAAIPLQGGTAHYLINSTFKVQPHHTVLFHAGAGGVGGIAIQLLKAKGATVIATVSSGEKGKIAYAHGADHVIGYKNFGERVRTITQGAGVDVVYDSVGKDTFDESLSTLKKRGMMVLFGGASGQVPPLDPQKLNQLGSLFLTRPTIGDYMLTQEEFSWRMQELFDAVLSGKLTLTIDQQFALQDAAEAHRYLEARKTRGKVLLIP